ncbi:LacI family DNA-binding transcriptional regulator [Microbacterium sp. NPDC089695]|uniref:LacI family DNA-binding transcriptional regulator n=1 Tax=Microbacterium sp. NPDC089695 TaxID=3364198 RepID=UPI003817FC8A
MANLSDVAALAGVSVSVVSRVLADAPGARVSDATRERIREAARTLDYQPNFAARALRSSRSHIIALIVPDVTNAIFAELMEGVEETALERDYTVVLGRAEDMQPGGPALRRLVGERRVDGMLVQLRDEPTAEEVGSLADPSTPAVFINSLAPAGIGSVVLPDVEGAMIATRHLIDLGHTRIGMIGGKSDNYTAQRRSAGFRDACATAGIDVPLSRVAHVGYSAEDGRRGLRQLLSAAEAPTAIFVANVNAALGALLEARRLGVTVPKDLSIVAMHDVWMSEYSWPPLSTVRMPLRQLGSDAVRELLRRLDDSSLPPAEVLVTDPAPQLIVRESTVAPPEHPE